MSASSEAPDPAHRRGRRAFLEAARAPVLGATLVAGIVAVALRPQLAAGQTGYESLHDECASAYPGILEDVCADAVLALQAFHGGLGFALTAGGPLPSGSSTAGRRIAAQPRIVFDGGLIWASFRHPDLGAPLPPSGVPDHRTLVLGARGTVVGGLFDGFSPFPGIGGVLSLDLVGQLALVRLSPSDGFSGSMTGLAGGVRVGVFRESFSLPGVTVSALYHRGETTEYGDGVDENGGGFELEPRVRSVRITVGKDLLAVGISAGVGWDEYVGSARIRAHRTVATLLPAPGFATAEAGPTSLESRRRYFFVGGNLTWLVAQVAAEISFSRERAGLLDVEGTGFHEAGATEVSGALTVRVTY